MPIASSQITIIDYNDALTLTGFITANMAKTQIYNPDNGSYSPNWAGATKLLLTPSLFKMGDGTDLLGTGSAQIQSVKWYDAAAPTTQLTDGTTYGIPASGLKTLTVKENLLSGTTGAKDFICEVVYRDPTTSLDLAHKMSISFSRVVNGGGITMAVVTTPSGNVFKNNLVSTLPVTAELKRGSVTDTADVTYEWFKQDPSQVTDGGAGIGWKKITAGNTYGGITNYTTATMTVPAASVVNLAAFKVKITDTDVSSNTNGQSFYDTAVLYDQSDLIQVSIASSGGDVFKNGQGSTTLTARVFRAGVELDVGGTTYTYRWYKYDKNGNLVTGFGGAGIDYQPGKTLTVGDADVDVKATFSVELS